MNLSYLKFKNNAATEKLYLLRMYKICELISKLEMISFSSFLDIPGWRLSNDSIHVGLESAFLPGRNQILTLEEAEVLGLPGTTILIDGGRVLIS